MSQQSIFSSGWSKRSRRPARSSAYAAALALGALAWSAPSQAQTWSQDRQAPLLWQIVSIDRTGDEGFPYGREDVAGDGLATFATDEQGSDLRSVYADADAQSLWLRAYVAGSAVPPNATRAFFFLDTDARDTTGSDARGAGLPELADDPTTGGYERVLVVSSGAEMVQAYQWDTTMKRWVEQMPTPPSQLAGEQGSARDPLLLGAPTRGYFQVRANHALSGLTASCGGRIFVRLRHEGTRTISDDAPEERECRGGSDAYGDPVVLRSFTCTRDDQCPSGGRCREGVCLFTYQCSTAADCRIGETCTAGACVRTVDRSCTESSQCGELVCEAGGCVACAESGARACAQGLLCSPNGACVDPDRLEPGAGGRPGFNPDEKVEGGAFTCTASRLPGRGGVWSLLLLAVGLTLTCRLATRRSRAQRAARLP